MKKRLPIIITMLLGYLMFAISLFPSIHRVYGETVLKKVAPIFNGNDGLEPKLKLIECSSFEDTYNPKSYPDYNFRSKKLFM